MENTIITLLYKYDCVIVPGLGGFIAKKVDSEFNPINYTFSPPKKKVGFNSDLIHTDGLLANAVASEQKIDYNSAVALIEKNVTDWKLKLNKGEKVKIKGLGTLKQTNNLLDFTPENNINFSLETFGLQDIKSTYILREKKEVKTDTSISWGSYVAAVALAVIVGATSFFANDKLVQPQLSSILPVTLNTEVPSVQEKETPVTVVEDESSDLENITENTVVVEEKEVLEDKSEVEEETNTEENNSLIKQYQVIGGSYKTYHRAMKREAEMKKAGYKDAVIIGKVGSFFMVAYKTFDTEEQALELKRALEQGGKDVFLRK
ncbi:SPOR domain-containing protein [Weeksellaceae bacterium TAE3-ERU29]|nr:SPOR domain-containing protein [Weeksellaceae bacterium TAE3-ERU29]